MWVWEGEGSDYLGGCDGIGRYAAGVWVDFSERLRQDQRLALWEFRFRFRSWESDGSNDHSQSRDRMVPGEGTGTCATSPAGSQTTRDTPILLHTPEKRSIPRSRD